MRASGDVELKRYSLIFAEKGRGKTTLCALLRSLQSGDPAHVLGRTTPGGTDTPEIQIRLEGGQREFHQRGLESFCKALGAGALCSAEPGHQLFSFCEGLEELNEYRARRIEPIKDGELQGMVKKTLTITG